MVGYERNRIEWKVAFWALLLCGVTTANAQSDCSDMGCDVYSAGCDTPGCDSLCVTPESIGCFDRMLDRAFPCLFSPLSVDVLYTVDAMSNTEGGIQTGGVYKGLLDIVLRADLAAMGLETLGGTFVLHGQNSHGPSLARYVGATQSTNIDANAFTAMAEFYWEREMLDGDAVVRIGRQVGAIQFSIMDPAADFLYGGFIISPNNPMPWYPNPTIGITGKMQLTDVWDVRAGAFNGGAPNLLSPWGWSENGSVYSVVETNCRYTLCGLPGDSKKGFWYSSANAADTNGGAAHSDNYGFYTGVDQMLFSERCIADQGLAAFFIYSWAPSNRNVINQHYAGGLVYRGLLPGRDSDVVGVGVSTVDFSNDTNNPNAETLVETFYKTHLFGKLMVQPAVQAINNPSGTRPDALVAGVRLGIEF